MWTDKLRFSLSLVELDRNICSTTKTCLNFTLVSSEMFINVSKVGLCRLLLGIKTSGRFGSVCCLGFFDSFVSLCFSTIISPMLDLFVCLYCG